MVKTITTLDMRHKLGEYLNKVNIRDDQYIIKRKGKALAAIVPVWQFEKWQTERKVFFKKIESVRKNTSKISFKNIKSEVDKAVAEAKKAYK